MNDNSLEEIAHKITAPFFEGSQLPARFAAYSAILEALHNERERCERLALNPYGDEVQALGSDEPKAVGEKIARAIREGR